MIGVGNGFSTNLFDNNALIFGNLSKALIDCGITSWQSLSSIGIKREEIETIFITHLHFDHSGGLESAALFSKYFGKFRYKLIIPYGLKDIIWENYLKGSLENLGNNINCLEDYFDVIYPKENEVFEIVNGVNAKWESTHHIDGKFSCSLFINNKLYYTSDMTFNEKLLTKAISQGASLIFHDCNFNNGITHTSYSQLEDYSTSIKEKLFLMHHGQKDKTTIPTGNKYRFLYQYDEVEF
jgi:ribonuclease BN (tRNA processing enzyme)